VQEDEATQNDKKCDMVEALLANEAQRKKEREAKAQQEEALLHKRKELKALSIEDLKKRAAKKGIEVSGKKEDMIEALFISVVQEHAANLRKEELKAKSQQDLKEFLGRQGLESGSKEQMIKTLLAHEAKIQQDLKAFDAKVGGVATEKGKELEAKSNTALKDMCIAKGLPVGGGKEEKIERLVEVLQKDGELDKVVSKTLREKRKEELMAMDKNAVAQLCEKTGVNPLVKGIMVERIMMRESEGETAIAMDDAEPAAKKARKKCSSQRPSSMFAVSRHGQYAQCNV